MSWDPPRYATPVMEVRNDLQAVFFDFDGTILDTEEPAFVVWQELFMSYGCDLALDEWLPGVGTLLGFDPAGLLMRRAGIDLDPKELEAAQDERVRERLRGQPLRPGIQDLVQNAIDRGLKVAVVTSASTDWVLENLERMNLAHLWPLIVAANDDPSRSKPNPTLYLEACRMLEVEPGRGLAIEDSANGVAAAKAAGLTCVAFPNRVTRRMKLDAADVVVEDLADVHLAMR